jgi:hypothetical protein
MLSLVLCILVFLLAFALTSRSLVLGLAACVGLGYVFGVVRANILDTFSFLIWDASVLGVYAGYFSRQFTAEELRTTETLRLWIAALIVWAVLVTLVPLQHPLIQLVGLRGNTFLLLFLLIGARLKAEELDGLACFLAGLNLMALGVAVMEYFVGIEPFFPQNAVTQLIYNSRDVAGNTAYRIPAFFINAHAYAGTMVISLPFILGAWSRETTTWKKHLLSAGMVAALIGVFLGASRTHSIVLFAIMGTATFSGRMKSLARAGIVMMLLFTGWVVSSNERLQRFTSLLDTEYITERVSSSINLPFLTAAMEYPFGIGMGGGGTSIPFFLQSEITHSVAAENEYARIMLEEGVLGLLLWIAFIGWLLARQTTLLTQPSLGRRLAQVACFLYFAMACLGTGMLTSVPQTALLMMAAGWASSDMENA